MFTKDTRTETFLTQMGVDFKYTQRHSVDQLRPGWDNAPSTRGLSRDWSDRDTHYRMIKAIKRGGITTLPPTPCVALPDTEHPEIADRFGDRQVLLPLYDISKLVHSLSGADMMTLGRFVAIHAQMPVLSCAMFYSSRPYQFMADDDDFNGLFMSWIRNVMDDRPDYVRLAGVLAKRKYRSTQFLDVKKDQDD